MKRIFFSTLIFVFSFNLVTFAWFDRIYDESGMTLESHYLARYAKYSDGEVGIVFFVTRKFQKNSTEILSLTMRSRISQEGQTNRNKILNDILLTKENPPQFEIHKNNSVKTYTFSKKINLSKMSKSVNDDFLFFSFSHKDAKYFRGADKLVMIFPTQNVSQKRINIPADILKEWQYILNTNYNEQPKEELIYTE